jgi:kumamolisin
MAASPIAGSERQLMPGARPTGPADPTERLEVSVILRSRETTTLQARVNTIVAGTGVSAHLTRPEFAAQFGAAAGDLDAVSKFAVSHGLTVVQQHAARRTLILAGSVAQFSAAFGVTLDRCEYAGGSYRGRTGAIQLPPELHDIVIAVLGLDDRPQARTHFRIRETSNGAQPSAQSAAAASFTPRQVADLYEFPPGTGQGSCIAIIELGGGYRPADLKLYFERLAIALPSITSVSVDHGKNRATGSANGPDGEVMLDLEVAGAIAPGAKLVTYFSPNTDAGFLDAVTTAIHDDTNKPSVISISWGGPESTWTRQAMTAFDQAFQAAATMGITVCVASGDNGSSDGVTDGANHVDFPASSPHALACGGTTVRVANDSISNEAVWNDGAEGGASGGGVSGVFGLPAWQADRKVTPVAGHTSVLSMRGVPDVAGDADPQSGYQVRVDGADMVFGGTSAVAPLWAALIARINGTQGAASVGFLNARLYAAAQNLNDITQGNNGKFAAATGWDACTGLGSPDGKGLAALLRAST